LQPRFLSQTFISSIPGIYLRAPKEAILGAFRLLLQVSMALTSFCLYVLYGVTLIQAFPPAFMVSSRENSWASRV
jgi:hypothetical protein